MTYDIYPPIAHLTLTSWHLCHDSASWHFMSWTDVCKFESMQSEESRA